MRRQELPFDLGVVRDPGRKAEHLAEDLQMNWWFVVRRGNQNAPGRVDRDARARLARTGM